MSLGKCNVCLDEAVARDGERTDLAAVPAAVVMITVLQAFPQPGGNQVMAPAQMALCVRHRAAQLGTVSKAGLVTA